MGQRSIVSSVVVFLLSGLSAAESLPSVPVSHCDLIKGPTIPKCAVLGASLLLPPLFVHAENQQPHG